MDQLHIWSCRPATDRNDMLHAALMATEHAYFRMGAALVHVEMGEIATMPGLAELPAAAVAQRVDPEAIDDIALAEVENILLDAGACLSRIYVSGDHGGAARILSRAGYSPRTELAFAGEIDPVPTDIRLRPVVTQNDWELKEQLHVSAGRGPDGHSHDAKAFVRLERAKVADGLQCFLAESDGEIVGAIGAIWGSGLVRAKNVLVHPVWQRHGVATAMLGELAAMGRDRGLPDLGVFGIDGEAGSALYRSSGLSVVGTQTEWSRSL